MEETAGSLCDSQAEYNDDHNETKLDIDRDSQQVTIGDFTYKEKVAVESMIHQLERELFKDSEQQQSTGKHYDSRP